MESKDQDMSDQQVDLLIRSAKKQKEQEEDPAAIKQKISFLDCLLSKSVESDINFVTQSLDNINPSDEQENPNNHPHFIPLTTSDKLRLYSPWKHSIIIKLIGKRMTYTFKADYKLSGRLTKK
ncbi:hypothetical protein RDI58_017641 [Solanum bulbocastanum]|uniref:Uncharacterized protein n=1 Tax=Solanum bulbocastanum TaxID=147425 RepID=A0AAN8TFE9_SOLBU